MLCLGIFRLKLRNSQCHVVNQQPRICKIGIFLARQKSLKFASEKGLFAYSNLVFIPSNLSRHKVLRKRKQIQILVQQCVRHLGRNLKQTIVIFEINSLQYVQMQSFLQNKKNFKFGTENALFRYLDKNLEKLLSYLKSAPPNLSKSKVS